MECANSKLPLFRKYPRLRDHLAHVPLGSFPTPVEKLTKLGDLIGVKNLYVKRDDRSGSIYGGNKVRKLEFLLADAVIGKAKRITTFGFAGSNHTLATAIYARELGLETTAMLLAQENARYVGENLLSSRYFNAELLHYEKILSLSLAVIGKYIAGKFNRTSAPFFIPAGGSAPRGIVGYVNAVFELGAQIASGEMPEPDLIYAPLGSMGTVIGIAIGIRAAGLKSRVIGVRVIEERMAGERKLRRLFRQTCSLLRRADPDFPEIKFLPALLHVENGQLGGGYARCTESAERATKLAMENAGLKLNGTYSAKAFAALLADAEKNLIGDKTVLFWNTYNSRDLSAFASQVDYRDLPGDFHRYFTKEVQTFAGSD